MIVAVFGSAAPKPGSLAYSQAEALGKVLAEMNATVMTGGYCGTMEAVSKGAAENGGKTIGVTCKDIDQYRPGGPNRWVQEEIPTENLNRRLEVLTRQPDAFLGLPGGLGTLCEITLALNLMAVESITPRPLILIGEGWRKSWSAILESNQSMISSAHAAYLQFAKNNIEATQLLKRTL